MKNVTLDTAKKLKEAGWLAPTEKIWMTHFDIQTDHFENDLFEWSEQDSVNKWVAAPDTDELLEALPEGTILEKWRVNEYDAEGGGKKVVSHHYAAEALAALWLQLKSQNLL